MPEHESLQAPESTSANVLGRLRAQREELLRERHLDVPIPGYRGELWARFRPIDWVELRQIAQREAASDDERAALHSQADTLVTACEEVYARTADGGRIALGGDGEPARFDEALAEALEIKADTARDVLLAVVANDFAVTSLWDRVTAWMSGASQEVDEQFVGES